MTYHTKDWKENLSNFNKGKVLLSEEIKRIRNLNLLPVQLPNGHELRFSIGSHNDLQKAIIEEFLPRFGSDCQVLYVGDGANKFPINNQEELNRLNFFDISHGMLPDIVAYSKDKNWIFLIEAFYSTGSISEIRKKELEKKLS